MKKFIYLYFGGNNTPSTPEEGKQVMDKWMAYFNKLGSHIVDGGAPFGERKVVNGETLSDVGGYSIISAESIDEAVSLTEGLPHLETGGRVEVIECMPVM